MATMTIVEAMESAKLFQPMFRKRGLLKKSDSWADLESFSSWAICVADDRGAAGDLAEVYGA